MKKRLLSLLLCLVMVLSACTLCMTGCAKEEEVEEEEVDLATTLVMWCVTEKGTDDEQAQAVAKAMSEKTQSEFKTKLIVKYFTLDEYYEQLETAMAQLEADKIAEEEAERKRKEEEKLNKGNKNNKNEQQEQQAQEVEQEKSEDDDEVMYDENGNPIIDKTVYPEVKDYQVDILYLSGYDKYTEYIAKKWIVDLNAQLSSEAKKISSYVPSALLNAVRYSGATYAIPNNNVIGEYTYMLIDKQLFDKYYYTAQVSDIHGVSDLAPFLEDIAEYEPDVVPINGDVDYCMSLLANYWDVDPETFRITGDFSVLGYAYEADDKINRGDIALKFDSLLTVPTYCDALKNLMNFRFKDYFRTPAEGQKSAVSFAKGDAATATQYEEDYYVVVVDYPRAADEDIYANMLAVGAFTSDVKKSTQIITYLNTDADFRNLFQYGIENVNYTLGADGTVSMTRTNAYNMDLAKTGNEFIAYVPKGTNLKVWEYAKQQNREALVNPLLGFDFNLELSDDSELLAKAEDGVLEEDEKLLDEYVIETLDTELITHLAELSESVWARIQACAEAVDALRAQRTEYLAKQAQGTLEEGDVEVTGAQINEAIDAATEKLNTLLSDLAVELAPATNAYISAAMVYKMVDPEYDLEGNLVVDDAEDAEEPTVNTKCEVRVRLVDKEIEGILEENIEEFYFVKTKYLTPYQVYYRWMVTYKFLPAGF
ncbi:MAG: hypothetical protein IIX15_02890 [Clostridia bacterium]|nr:hypothetical protein [Clostridia bacterium]